MRSTKLTETDVRERLSLCIAGNSEVVDELYDFGSRS